MLDVINNEHKHSALTGRIISAAADDFRSLSPMISEIMAGDGYTLRVVKP